MKQVQSPKNNESNLKGALDTQKQIYQSKLDALRKKLDSPERSVQLEAAKEAGKSGLMEALRLLTGQFLKEKNKDDKTVAKEIIKAMRDYDVWSITPTLSDFVNAVPLLVQFGYKDNTLRKEALSTLQLFVALLDRSGAPFTGEEISSLMELLKIPKPVIQPDDFDGNILHFSRKYEGGSEYLQIKIVDIIATSGELALKSMVSGDGELNGKTPLEFLVQEYVKLNKFSEKEEPDASYKQKMQTHLRDVIKDILGN